MQLLVLWLILGLTVRIPHQETIPSGTPSRSLGQTTNPPTAGIIDWTRESQVTLIVLGAIFAVLAVILLLVCCSRRAKIARGPQENEIANRSLMSEDVSNLASLEPSVARLT